MKTIYLFGWVMVATLTGCSTSPSLLEVSRPNSASMYGEVEQVITPTRLKMKFGVRSFAIDLAYLYPSTVLCRDSAPACKALEDKVLGKAFWVDREYDKYGLPMHTLWEARDNAIAEESLNIDLIINDGYDRMADFMDLPNNQGELVAKAADLGLAKYHKDRREQKLLPWQKKQLDNLEGK